jgi:UDP:flavonoid glycosyltransferase YjiC (YdhE family)
MVAIPIASEQPGIAMRIARLGAGTVVPLAEVSATSIVNVNVKLSTIPNSFLVSTGDKMRTRFSFHSL